MSFQFEPELVHSISVIALLLSRLWLRAGRYWRSLQRSAPTLECSLSEVLRGDADEAETVSAMASLSVANKHFGKKYVGASLLGSLNDNLLFFSVSFVRIYGRDVFFRQYRKY